jgi:hypothetical protein
LLPYFADTEKVRFLLPNGQYVRTPRLAPRTPTNGTRFNVQEFFVDIAEDREELDGTLPGAVLEKLRNSPVYDVLSAGWNSPVATAVSTELSSEHAH